MALENAAAPAKRKRGQAPEHRSQDVDRVPVEIPRDQWDRPLILPEDVDPSTVPVYEDRKQLTAYTRASSLGEAIEDHYAIERRNLRYLALGLGRSRALWMLAKAVPEPEEGPNRKTLDGIVKDALKLAGADDLADIGTALHAMAARECAGELIERAEVAEDAQALDAIADVMTRFEVLLVEAFVVNDELRAAGTFDYLVRTLVDLPAPDGTIIPAGTVLILDLKTASTSRYFGAKFATQFLVYAGGKLYDPATGERTEFPVSQRWAILLHAPSGGTMAQLHVLDLDIARRDAEAAVLIREVRKVKGRFTLVTDLPEAPEHCVDCDEVTATASEPACDACEAALDAQREPEAPVSSFSEGDPNSHSSGPSTSADVTPAHPAGCECFACTGQTFAGRIVARFEAAERSAPTAVPLMEAIRLAPDRAALDALWAARHAEFADTHKAVAKVRAARFETQGVTT